MDDPPTCQTQPHPSRLFIEEILRTGLMLIDLIDDLLESLPEDAFPGEDPAEVLVEMLAGSIRPATDAAGPATLREAIALLCAVRDRTLSDLRAAAKAAAGDRRHR